MVVRRLAASVAIALAIAIGMVASADPPLTLEELAAAINRAASEPDGERVVVGHISRTLGTPVETLRAQRTRTGLGWGQLLIASRVTREAGLSFDQVVADIRSGKSWVEVVGAHMDLARLVGEVQRSKEIIEQRGEDKPPSSDGKKGPSRPNQGGSTGRGGRRP